MSTNDSAAKIAALIKQGIAHHHAGRLAEADKLYRQALALDAGHPEALAVMGILLGQAGRLPESVEFFIRALKRDPRNAHIHYNLGETYRHLGEGAKSETALRRAIALNPNHYDAYQSLADLLLAEAALQDKAGRYQRARELRATAAGALAEAGRRFLEKDMLIAAAEKYRAVVALAPDVAAGWRGLAHAIRMTPSEAEPVLRRAIALDPEFLWSYGALGDALMALDRPAEAEAVYRQGLARAPDDAVCRQGLDWINLMTPLYRPGSSPERIFAAHRAWGEQAMAQAGKETARTFANARDPGKRLKVGFVSPDLKQHSVNFFFEPLLAALDPEAVETFCYAELAPHQEDGATARLKKLAGHWRSTSGKTDEELRRQVRQDGIDILIDLAGHTAQNRLSAFAVKPAPVTATWLGYPTTTGLPTIDCRITDAIADPPGAEQFHTEKLMRLEGGFLCYRPPGSPPEVAQLPALAKGFVTFGSFNNIAKINESVAATWASLLRAVPGSRLLLKATMIKDKTIQEALLRMLTAAGIDPARINVEIFQSSTLEHLTVYDRVDIALDPFPYNGTTTTCEALWMGVPVVALIGDRHSGRVGFDLLTRVGLPQMAAPDAQGYVRVAAELARDLPALSSLRQGLRERLCASPLCDKDRFAREFESALRTMWKEWCEGGGARLSIP